MKRKFSATLTSAFLAAKGGIKTEDIAKIVEAIETVFSKVGGTNSLFIVDGTKVIAFCSQPLVMPGNKQWVLIPAAKISTET
jgi:hypothetical protein